MPDATHADPYFANISILLAPPLLPTFVGLDLASGPDWTAWGVYQDGKWRRFSWSRRIGKRPSRGYARHVRRLKARART